MKKTPLIFLLILSMKARSQENESFFVFDADWKPTQIEHAKFFLHEHQVNDSCWQWDFYNFIGPLIRTEQYRDKDGHEMNGVCYYFDKKGINDSMTTYTRGMKNGDSWKWRSNLKSRITYKYLNDSLVEVIDDRTKKKDTTVSYKDEKESEYPGGLSAWNSYMSEKLVYPERAMSAFVQGQVNVQFIVDAQGNVINSRISRSVEYSIDEEALKIINNSGKWEPAFQNGHNVKSYKMQPVVFKFQ